MASPTTEAQVQSEVIGLLDSLESAGLLVYRRINSGARMYGGRRVRAVKRGTPDIWVGANGRSGWMELKRPKGGVLSVEQIIFRQECALHRIPWVEVKSLEQAIQFLSQELLINGLPTFLAG